MDTSASPALPLYHRVLGEAFESLPPVLRRFHEQTPEACAQGSLHITRGAGWIRQILAAAMRLPSPGAQIPATLRVRTEGALEYWTRDFGGLHMATRQWQQGDLLMEAAGPLQFGFCLTADAVGMGFECVRCRLFGIPLPRALSPRIVSTTTAEGEGWRLYVRIDAPLLGMLAQYEGDVTPSC